MADVIVLPFGRRPRVVCSEVTQAHANNVQSILSRSMAECPECGDSGLRVRAKNLRLTQLEDFDIRVCTCSADIDLDSADFGGAA